MSGKGSTPRPIPDRKKYESEFDRIFGKNKKKKETKDKKEKKRLRKSQPGGKKHFLLVGLVDLL